jgi:hypothetical protein
MDRRRICRRSVVVLEAFSPGWWTTSQRRDPTVTRNYQQRFKQLPVEAGLNRKTPD